MNKSTIANIVFLITLILSLAAVYAGYLDLIYSILLVILYALILLIFSMNIQSGFYLKAINSTEGNSVLLTFDDGPHPENTKRVLDILKEKKVKAMFFLIGKNAEKYPDLVKRIHEEGHLIGGHSYDHKLNFGFLGRRSMEAEILRGQQVISRIIGIPIKWFRPPFGVTNPNVRKAVYRNDLITVGWNARSFDTSYSDPSKLLEKCKKLLRPGNILLLHDRLSVTAEILDQLIQEGKNRNLEFKTLE